MVDVVSNATAALVICADRKEICVEFNLLCSVPILLVMFRRWILGGGAQLVDSDIMSSLPSSYLTTFLPSTSNVALWVRCCLLFSSRNMSPFSSPLGERHYVEFFSHHGSLYQYYSRDVSSNYLHLVACDHCHQHHKTVEHQ